MRPVSVRHFRLRSLPGIVAPLLATVFLALTCPPARSQQVLYGEWTFPASSQPRVLLSNASIVSITAWDKNEVSIRAEVMGEMLRRDEVRVNSSHNRFIASCSPTSPGRKIFLTVRVPNNALLWVEANGNSIEISQPSGEITLNSTSSELLQLSVPETSALDLRDAPNALERRNLGPLGNARIGISGQRLGAGPPHVKINAPKSQVLIGRETVELASRPATLAATTIARRGGILGDALRRSSPHLIREPGRFDQPKETAAQNPRERPLKVETYLVNVNISATDRSGRAVSNLTKEDFCVYEDGVLQQISFFSPQQTPFNLVLLIDLSGSMRGEEELVRETALQLLEVISTLDSVAVVTFTTDVVVASHLTKDRDELRDSIELMLAPAGGTAFYDAVGFALVEMLRKVKGQRNAVIAISDGEDNALQSRLPLRAVGASIAQGSFLTFDQLLEGSAESDALIYPIHISPAIVDSSIPQSTSLKPTPTVQIQTSSDPRKLVTAALTSLAKDQLNALADASGGRFYHADRIEDLKEVFDQVAAELRTVYSIAYTPTNQSFDASFRRIRIQLKKEGVVVRTRSGYIAR